MAICDTLDVDTITIDAAGELDAAWTNSGMPDNGLRIYGLRRTGNGMHTFLGVPGTNGHNPAYILSNGRYLHVSGPTLADWQRNQFNEIDLGNEAHYRSLAAESQDATNVALFTERADFYAQRASRR